MEDEKCPKCSKELEERIIDTCDIADGDGMQTYGTDKYYYCCLCDQWYDADLDKEEDEPIQGPLI